MKPAFTPLVGMLECFGLPGVGKSTAVGQLNVPGAVKTIHHMRDDWRHRSGVSKTCWILRCIVFDMRVFLLVLYSVVKLRIYVSFDGTRRIFRTPFQMRRYLDAMLHDPVVLDQGILQDIWASLHSAANLSPDRVALTRLISGVYQDVPALVLFLSCNPEHVAPRIERRAGGSSRFDILKGTDLKAELSMAVELSEAIAASVEAAGVRIVHIDAMASVECVARQCRDAVFGSQGIVDAGGIEC